MTTETKRFFEASESAEFFTAYPQVGEKAKAGFEFGSGVYVCADGKVRTTGYGPSRDMPKVLRNFTAVLKPRNGWSG